MTRWGLVAVVVVGAGCGSSGPSPAVVKARWQKAVADGDTAAMFALLDPRVAKALLAELDRTAKAAAELPRRALATELAVDRALATDADAKARLADRKAGAIGVVGRSAALCYQGQAPTLDDAAIGKRGGGAFVVTRLGGFYQDGVLATGILELPGCSTPPVADEPNATGELDIHVDLGDGLTDTQIKRRHDDAAATIASEVAGVAAADRRAFAQALGDLMAFHAQYGLDQQATGLPSFHVDRTGAVTVSYTTFDRATLGNVEHRGTPLAWKLVP